LLSPKALFSAQNASETVWWPGFARTRWGSLQRSPDPLAGFRVEVGEEGKGRESKGREGRFLPRLK